MLEELVKAGKLPPVEERLPKEPMVLSVLEEIGQYGGTWDTAVTGMADMRGATSYMLETWVRWNPDCSQWEPSVAKKVEVSEDGTEWTFYMREGMKWSDGEPFTADDIMFWYEDVILNDELTPSKPSWMKTGGELGVVEKVDDYTVKFKFSKPHGMFPLLLAFVWGANGGIGYPAHYLKQFHPKYVKKEDLDQMVKDAGVENWTQLFAKKVERRENPDIPSIAAWKLIELGPPFIWERNPYFYKVDPEGNQLPYIDRVRYLVVEDKQMISMKAVAGELTHQARNISFSDMPLYMDNREKGDYRVIKSPTVLTGAIVYPNQNLRGDDVLRDIIRDVRFRKALNLAIKRDEINELVYLGESGPIEDVFPGLEPEYFEHLKYDPEQAKALLDEMGLEVGPDGYRMRPDGKQLVIKIDTMAGYMDPIQLIASYWEEIGLKVAPEEVSYDLWWPRINSWEYAFSGYTMSAYPGLSRLIYMLWFEPVSSSTYWAPAWGMYFQSEGQQGDPPEGDAAKMIEIHRQIEVTIDPAKQQELINEIMRLYLKNAYTVLTTGYIPGITIVKNQMRNVPDPVTFCILHDNDSWAEQYFIKQA